MRSVPSVCLVVLVALLMAPLLVGAEVRQAGRLADGLWWVGDGSAVRLGIRGRESRLELPPGATIDDLATMADGWLAAGRLPAGDGTELLIVRGGDSGNDLLAVPARSAGRLQGRPVLVVDDGQLAGLVWLEGDGPTALEVRAAAWDGGAWAATELVSPRAPGSQVAPALTVLADGSWLLIWTAFDGIDDDVLWSVNRAGKWSKPRRLHPDNTVPDITPAIAAVGNGAVAVWSRFDGNDYRLQIARFDGDRWEEPTAHGGKGSGDPLLLESESGALLLFHTVETAAWSVFELDRTGVPVLVAQAAVTSYEKPLLVMDEEENIVLRWLESGQPERGQIDLTLEWQEVP